MFENLTDKEFLRYGRSWRDRLPGYYRLMCNPKILDAIESLAVAVRAAWGLGQDPIPVLTDMLEERGILVIQCGDMPVGKFDGLAATVDGKFYSGFVRAVKR